MLAKLPEKRLRQKPKRSMRREVNPEALEYFQISINILEARNVLWKNSKPINTYVLVTLGEEKYRTNVRKNMDDTRYKEYLLFEWYTTKRELQQSKLWLAVMEPRYYAPPRLLGETTIDLGVIWAQTNHQVFHKWAQLCLPRDPGAGAVGFLKVDISILCRGDVLTMPVLVSTEVDQYQHNVSSSEQQSANYLITVFSAFGLFGGQGKARMGKLPSTYVKVSFRGLTMLKYHSSLKAKTAVQHGSLNPVFCEQISFMEAFPNVCQSVILEVCTAEIYYSRTLASAQLNLANISHDGDNGFVPTFGPSLLHMYGPYADINHVACPGGHGPFYKGAILVAFKLKISSQNLQNDFRTASIEPVPSLLLESLWSWEEICIFCPILEVSVLEHKLSGKFCGVAVTIGEVYVDDIDNGGKRKLHYTGPIDVVKSNICYGYLNFCNAYPVLQLATHLPDFRFRIFRNNMVQKIVQDLESTVTEVENIIKKNECAPSGLLDELREAIERTAENILKYFDVVRHFESTLDDRTNIGYHTELDCKQLELQKEELEKIYNQLIEILRCNSSISLLKLVSSISKENYIITKKHVKTLLFDTMIFVKRLKTLVFKGPDEWPDVILWLLNDGSRYAYCKIRARDIMFSEIPEQSGKDCGGIQTVYMQPLKCAKHSLSNECSCIVGKVELILWMGRYTDRSAFELHLPDGFHLRVKDFDMCIKADTIMLECCVYIHRAKITTDSFTTPSPYVRVNALNDTKDSKVECKTSAPVWNQMVIIRSMMRSSAQRLQRNPPKILVEIYDYNILGSDLIGRLEVVPKVCTNPNTSCAPTLKWYDLHQGPANVGQILMAARIWQIPETLIKSTTYGSLNNIDEEKGVQADSEGVDIVDLPLELTPKCCTYKVDVYWWGLREVNCSRKPCAVMEIDNLTIKSEVINSKNNNNCNFPNGRISHTFRGYLEYYSPPLTIKLYDSSTFGRILFLGMEAMKNPSKYLVDWMPKFERELSLKSASVVSKHFSRVHDTLFIMKDGLLCLNKENNVVEQKQSPWRKLFSKKESDETQLLLPIYFKDNADPNIMMKRSESEHQDWWSRFFLSQKNFEENNENKSKIKVYDSELENQPEFNKFKDWCHTIKLYNGKKTGMQNADVERSGSLKAGIAIYRWPPPLDTVAVNDSGVDLHNGYFNDHPTNNTSKILVRVYTVRGLNLTPVDFNRKCDPYVVIKCGDKTIGDRNDFQKNTVNPVFGRVDEFRCTLPEDYLLILSVFDHDSTSQDSLIGNTKIDLENRIYSKHRGTIGLSYEYHVTGISKWRDIQKPSDILEEVCAKNHLPPPSYPDGNSVVVNGVEYRDLDKRNKTYISASEKKENICLNLLHQWHSLPVSGYHLVPEHVETRKLYNPEKPNTEQGSVQIWIDMFLLNAGLYVPTSVDITPMKVEDYELRVIIWQIKNVEMEGVSPYQGLNLYVKAWIGDIEQAHYTDIHYNCVNGDATFNWRMVFHFQYQHCEKKLIKVEKDPFTEYEEHLRPILVVQVADSDSVIVDYIATLTLDLNAIPQGTKNAQRRVNINEIENPKTINLFTAKSIRSWWPLKAVDKKNDTEKIAGVIDLEMHLLSKHKAMAMPAGLGRNPPFALPEPNRPEEDFKAKILNSVFNRSGLKYTVTAVIVMGILLFGSLFFWEIPIFSKLSNEKFDCNF